MSVIYETGKEKFLIKNKDFKEFDGLFVQSESAAKRRTAKIIVPNDIADLIGNPRDVIVIRKNTKKRYRLKNGSICWSEKELTEYSACEV